jgi:hypothetical protein
VPQPSFHLHVADQLLRGWSDRPEQCPFDVESVASSQAFLHGSIGPDMGFFPGAARSLATAAHSGPTGDLARAMLRGAETDREVAFTYGWVTHILIDAFLHPLINQTAAELLGEPLAQADPLRVQHLHIRLEIGLELDSHRRFDYLQRIRLGRVLEPQGFRFLARAHELVQDLKISTRLLGGAHKRVCRILGPLMGLQASMAFARHDGAVGESSPGVWGLRTGLNTLHALATSVKGSESHTAAFLNPLLVPEELGLKIEPVLTRFRIEYAFHVARDLDTLPNYNVDDGSIQLLKSCRPAA